MGRELPAASRVLRNQAKYVDSLSCHPFSVIENPAQTQTQAKLAGVLHQKNRQKTGIVNCRLDAWQCQENADFAAKLGLLHFVEHRLRGKPKRLCNLDDVQESNIPLATFDHAYVIAMQAGEFSQLFLR